MFPRRIPALATALALGCVLMLAASPAVLAQEDDVQSAMRWFDGIDTDNDDVITLEETSRVLVKRFGRTDGNDDDYLTEDEYTYGVPPDRPDEMVRMRRRFAAMDVNTDGFASREEYMDFGHYVITTADADADGRVTRAEFASSVVPE